MERRTRSLQGKLALLLVAAVPGKFLAGGMRFWVRAEDILGVGMVPAARSA